MAHIQDDAHFRTFAQALEQAIGRYDTIEEEDLVTRQRRQVEKLVGLEKEFRKTLIKHRWGPGVFKAFIRFICEERKNILAARPFYRERQAIFTKEISVALKKKNHRSLYKFHFNYQFVIFAMSVYRWGPGGRVAQLAKEIAQIRNELIEMNMPLAISRARIFWSRTPKAQLSYMDLVQIASEGLMSAVDKFCLPYSPVFRSVAIGRMVGNFIEQYSETLIHYWPGDKRILYKANKLSGKGLDFEQMVEVINGESDRKVTAADVADLMAASSTVSADAPVRGNESEETESMPLDGFRADESCQPDVQYEQREAMTVMTRAIHQLPLTDRKLLRLKGISL